MGKKILVIDDDPHIVKMIESRLKSEGYTVLIDVSGEAGIKTAYNEKPDLILLDITMLGMNGLETLSKLKKTPETRIIPVVMLTGKSGTKEMLSAEQLGSVDYIIKPFETIEFLETISKYIDK